MKSTMNMHDDTPLSDNALRSLMQQLPEAPASPWFTRRVLHRLPPRKRRIAGRIEVAACVAGIIAVIVFAVIIARQWGAGGGFTVGDAVEYAALLGVFGLLTANLLDFYNRRHMQRISR